MIHQSQTIFKRENSHLPMIETIGVTRNLTMTIQTAGIGPEILIRIRITTISPDILTTRADQIKKDLVFGSPKIKSDSKVKLHLELPETSQDFF